MTEPNSNSANKVLNFNVGIFGHVDSGKTSLAKALSTTGSTAAFDKNPQSQQRGITLDLGFSSFTLTIDDAMREREERFKQYDSVQITLVDCPGHASLFKTVIGGAQIIDMVILVIDVIKGIQTQTAECLLLAEITCPGLMVIVENKTDLLQEKEKQSSLAKLEKRLRKTLQTTSFADAPFVPLSACPSPVTEGEPTKPESIDKLLETLRGVLFIPKRSAEGSFLFAVDHCFPIRGQGTVLTGTVLSGGVGVGDSIEIPSLRETKKVKSIQVFRQPVQKVIQGDRCGICLTQLESRLFERGIVCKPGALPATYAAVVSVSKIPYFKGTIKSKARFHISIGYDTVMGRCSFFSTPLEGASSEKGADDFDASEAYESVERVCGGSEEGSAEVGREWDGKSPLFALIQFEHPVICPRESLFLASRMDTDIHSNTCRLAFHGRLLLGYQDKDYQLSSLRVFKWKERTGVVDRMMDENTLIVHSLLKKETNVESFVGLRVSLSSGEEGLIEGGFGQSGKVKVTFRQSFSPETLTRLETLGGKKRKGKTDQNSQQPPSEQLKVHLRFKRFNFDPAKRMVQ